MNLSRGYTPRRSKTIVDGHCRGTGREPIGLIAGWGRFPVQVAQSLVRDGHPVCCIAILGHASTDLESICDHVYWSGVGKLGGHIRYFRRHGVNDVTMAGKLFKADLLYRGSLWLRHVPDWTCVKTLGPILVGRQRDARDDSLLLAITRAYASAGLTVRPATDFAPELLVKSGHLAGPVISSRLQHDIHRGWQIAKQMGSLDIGQAITIKDGTVIAVEAIEGTDACIERTGVLCRKGGWTLVKVAKPNQDMRFDVPTIGPQTIERVRAAGGTAIIIEAGITIIVDQATTLEMASKAGITLAAIDPVELASTAAVRTAA
jgi:DUF1009 family protein